MEKRQAAVCPPPYRDFGLDVVTAVTVSRYLQFHPLETDTVVIALEHGTPTHTLSDPIYNLPGLTCQLPLNEFWRNGRPPNQDAFVHFRRCVMHATQINGGFYCSTGMALAVENGTRILSAEHSPLESLR